MTKRSMELLTTVKGILGYMGGGVHKRIDENRELLELLQRDAPEFLKSHSWVENWLESNDEFFAALESNVPITEGTFFRQAQHLPSHISSLVRGLASANATRKPPKSFAAKDSWKFITCKGKL